MEAQTKKKSAPSASSIVLELRNRPESNATFCADEDDNL